jgi:hypothetical protein
MLSFYTNKISIRHLLKQIIICNNSKSNDAEEIYNINKLSIELDLNWSPGHFLR